MAGISNIPSKVIARIDNPTVAKNFRSTTWILFGALMFQLLACISSLRIMLAITAGLLLYRIIPAIMIAYGLLPNTELEHVNFGKRSVMFPTSDGPSGPQPSSEGLAVLILGVRISHPLGLLAPGAKTVGDFFNSLVEELNNHQTEHRWICGSHILGRTRPGSENDHISVIGYFRTVEDLQAFAKGSAHRKAWDWWNENAKSLPYLGLYHEIYDVPARHWETLYLQTPNLGLGRGMVQGPNGGMESLLVESGKGVWRTSIGRMGRGEGRTQDEDLSIQRNKKAL